MRELVIGDVHFGIKSNSVEWLEKQCKLINEQVVPAIESQNINRVVFLGDLFDVRYSINQQIAAEVKECIRNLADKLAERKAYLVFVAGNHDYYSPLESASKYHAYETVFGSEFVKCHPNVKFVTDEPLYIDDSLFLPWYWTDNTEHFDEILYRYDFGEDVKAVYCHADLSVWPGARIASLKGIPVYAGHIHYIIEDETCNLHNVGSVCALTFADVNQPRYIYILEDFKVVDKIENVSTPKFIRIYDDEIFKVNESTFDNSFVQLCVTRSNMEKATYADQLKQIKNKYTNANIRIHVVDDEDRNTDSDTSKISFSPNINEYIHSNIPAHLSDKLDIIKNKLIVK